MPRRCTIALLCLFLVATVSAQESQEKTQAIAELLRPTLVRIHVVESVSAEGREVRQESFGSGVIVTADGCVVTNHHVAGKAIWLSATLSDKSEVDAKLVGTDPLSDVAVIQLAPRKDGQPYPIAKWGDSSKLRIGEHILAIGCPLAFSQSVTSGIVSNNELILPKQMGEMDLDGEDVGSIVRWIGHDAQIRPGNSGGPLVNMDGEIVGINEISVGLGGAIPSNLVRDVFEQIHTSGHVTRAYLGFDLQPRTSQSKEESGALVGNVDSDSPAAKSGVLPGDLILSVGTIKLDTRYREQIPPANLELSRLAVGANVEVSLKRNGQLMTLNMIPTLRKAATGPEKELVDWGVTATELTESVVRDARLALKEGLVVTGVAAGGPASEAQPPLKPFDIIVKASGRPMKSLDDASKLSSALTRKETGTPTLVEVVRNGEHILTIVNLSRLVVEDTSTEVARPWVPVEIQVVTPVLANALGLPEGTRGVRVTKLYKDAKAMGVQLGDVITAVDGIAIDASQSDDAHVFTDLIGQYKVGASVSLAGYRGTAAHNTTIKLPRAKKRQQELARYPVEGLGLSLRDASFEDQDDDSDEVPTGVIVADVQPGSWAALAGLQAGDQITKIDDGVIGNLAIARKKLEALRAGKAGSMVVYVASGNHVGFMEVRTQWDRK